jgi:DNA-directed RNA polymerase specialized sigma24 family protein
VLVVVVCREAWELNREALDALLGALAEDRNLAGRKYEELRRRLINLFAWERCEAPDQLADEALNRLAKKVADGTEIPALDRYAFGIARFLLQEEARKRQNRAAALFELKTPAKEEWAMLDMLEDCLKDLPTSSRELIERYYVDNRASLAREHGISINALRNRALRIRQQLMDCVSLKRGK